MGINSEIGVSCSKGQDEVNDYRLYFIDVRSNDTNVVNLTQLCHKAMGVFHIEHEKLIFTPFNCTHVLSIILPIWDVLAKLFEVGINITH